MRHRRADGYLDRLCCQLVLLLMFLVPVSLNGQDAGRIVVPETRISIVPPSGYKLLGTTPIFFSEHSHAVLTIVETSKPVREVFESYADPAHLAEMGFEAKTRPEDITIAGVPGKKFNISKRNGLLTEQTGIFRVFVVGDSLKTLTAIVSYPDTVPAASVEPLVAAVYSIRWDHAQPLTPMDILNFTISSPSGMKLANTGSRWQVYTSDGKLPNKDTLSPEFTLRLIPIPTYPDYRNEDHRRQLMESLIEEAHPNIKVTQVVEFNKSYFDGVRTFETVASGHWLPEGRSVAVYYTLIFHPVDFIAITGIVGGSEADRFLELFKASARSFKRNTIALNQNDRCFSLISERRYTEAASCYSQAVADSPASAQALLGKAEALRLEGNYDRAIVEYTSVLDLHKFCEPALLGRGRARAGKENYSEAIDDFSVAIELNGTNVSGYRERALARKKAGEYNAARDDYERAISLSPDSSALYAELGELQPTNEALKSYRKAIELDNACVLAYENRAQLYLREGQCESALADLNMAIRLRPHNKDLYAMRAETNARLNNKEAALRDMANGPDNAPFIALRGFQNGLARHIDASMKDFSHSLKLDSTDWVSYFLRGIISFLNGSYSNARADFRQAAARSASAEARAWLFFSDAMLYTWDDARKNLAQYCSNPVTQQEDWKDIVKYLMGTISEQQLVQSIKPFHKTVEAVTEKQRLNDARCDTYFAIGFKNYISGLKVGAKPYWKKCLETKRSSLVSYDVARALLEGK